MQLRDTVVEPEVVNFLETSSLQLRELFETRFQPLIRRWIRECISRAHALQEAARLAGEGKEAGNNEDAAMQLEQAKAARENAAELAAGQLEFQPEGGRDRPWRGGPPGPGNDRNSIYRRMRRDQRQQDRKRVHKKVDLIIFLNPLFLLSHFSLLQKHVTECTSNLYDKILYNITYLHITGGR